ncbi:nucleotidyltransferase family protein [Ligilactobacillus apodemi]|nr:nucleotidyltransferase family protein [Ligilactobacillus apodemi]
MLFLKNWQIFRKGPFEFTMTLEQKLTSLIENDREFHEIFNILREMKLTNAFICAGAIRDLVWNTNEAKPHSLVLGNIDIYYNDPNETYEQYLTKKAELNHRYSKYLWELTNTALKNSRTPTSNNMEDVIASFPETCSAVGICRSPAETIEIIAPYGLEDLFAEKICPTPKYKLENSAETFEQRVTRKKWLENYANAQLVIK